MKNIEKKKNLQISSEKAETIKELVREFIKKIDGKDAAKIGVLGVGGACLWFMLKEVLKSMDKKAA